MNCPNCGQENRDVALFCQFCGTRLKDVVEQADAPLVESTPPPVVEPVPIEPAVETDALENVDETLENDVLGSGDPHESDEVQLPELDLLATDAPSFAEIADTAALVEESELVVEEPVVEDELALEASDTERSDSSIVEESDDSTLDEQEPEQEPVLETEEPPAETVEVVVPEPEIDPEASPPFIPKESADPHEAPISEPDLDIPDVVSVQDVEEVVEMSEVVESESVEPSLDEQVRVEFLNEESFEDVDDIGADEAVAQEEAVLEDYSTDDLFWRDTPEPMTALEAGTVVNGRYQISKVLSAQKDQVLYRVRDLQRCPQCGFTGNNPDQAFCDSCGAMLDQKTKAQMLERSVSLQAQPIDAEPEDQFVEADRAYWVWRELEKPQVQVDDQLLRMQMTVGLKSDVGQKRGLDEDALFVFVTEGIYESMSSQLALFVVADGMGGHEGGEVASRLAMQALVGTLMVDVFGPELAGQSLSGTQIHAHMKKAVLRANEQVYLERQKRNSDMGTTITAVIVKDWTLYIAHVGDCRAYRFGSTGLEQLTTDHSVVASMIVAGTAQPDEIYTHPQRSVIYRSIGDRPNVDVDLETYALSSGERLVVCCDGLWEMIRNEGIEEALMREPDPQVVSELMVNQANMAGGDDNISVIVVQL